MKQTPTLIAAAVAAVLATPATAASIVSFEGGIGVQPVAGLAGGAPVPNTVRGVPPGGRPWVIARLKADVKANGTIHARGDGLIFAGSEAIGTPGGVNQVAASLFCGTPAAEFDSPAVPLDAAGNFRIDAPLTDATGATPPTPCDAPVLLIRNATGGTLANWFAAGIPTD